MSETIIGAKVQYLIANPVLTPTKKGISGHYHTQMDSVLEERPWTQESIPQNPKHISFQVSLEVNSYLNFSKALALPNQQ